MRCMLSDDTMPEPALHQQPLKFCRAFPGEATRQRTQVESQGRCLAGQPRRPAQPMKGTAQPASWMRASLADKSRGRTSTGTRSQGTYRTWCRLEGLC
jgi:hypothetical protein